MNVWPYRPAESVNNFLDHFPGSSLDSTKWTSVVTGTGAVTVTDSYVECNAPANSAAFIYYNAKIKKNVSQLWMFCVSSQNNTSPPFPMLGLINDDVPIAQGFATVQPKQRVYVQYGNPTGGNASLGNYRNSADVEQFWDAAAGTPAWGAFGATKYLAQPIRADDYWIVGIEIDAGSQRWRMLQWAKTYTGGYTFDQGWRLFALTDWVYWSATKTSDSLWMMFGQQYTDDPNARVFRCEWVRYCEQGPAGLIEGWTAAKASVSTGHTIRHHWSYDGKVFVPEDRATNALVPTGAGWESFDLQAPNAVRDRSASNIDYLFYRGCDSSFTVTGIGVAKAPSTYGPQNGPWTRGANNPIIAVQSGESAVRYFFGFKDTAETDPNKTWKCVYSVDRSSDGKQVVKLATSPDPPDTGPWTYQGQILGLGGAGAKDEGGLWGVQGVLWVDGQWEIWYTGIDASNTPHLLRAYGPSLTSLTKDTTDYYTAGSLTQSLTANLTGRIVTVASTTGFAQDQSVILDQDSNLDNWSRSRIRKVVSSTQLELYHSLDGFTTATPAKIRAMNSDPSIGGQELWRVGNEWWVYMTVWDAMAGAGASYGALCEENCLFTHSALRPNGATFTMDEFYSPVTARGFNSDLRSVENMGLLRGPLDVFPSKPASPQWPSRAG